jgi:hypothetical protein
MKKSEIVKKVIQIVNNSDNNYDAYDDVLELLEQSLPEEKVTKTKSNTVYVAMSPGTMEMRVDGIYDSKEQMMAKYKRDYGLEEYTDEEMEDYLSEGSYDTSTYHQSIQVSRDNKLSDIIG